MVIGGWLPDLLQRNRRLSNQCAQLDGIYVEMNAMAEALSRLGLLNVSVLPNFRKFDRKLKRNFITTTIPIRLVVYSRIFREKGIEDAIAALQKINEKKPDLPRAILDIYGPIEPLYLADFQKLLIYPQYIDYRGVLAPESACDVLQQYDVLLFPTYYGGEGFPGTLLDAYIAGLPVIASDWKYNSEIVEDGSTGLLFRTHAVEEIVEHIEMFIANPSKITQMHQNCIEKAQHYHVEDVVKRLLSGSTKMFEEPLCQIDQ